jgi:hypothetical protein
MVKPEDLPNFAAWSNKNLGEFATDAYIKMQEMAYDLEQERLNTKAALGAVRKLISEVYNENL